MSQNLGRKELSQGPSAKLRRKGTTDAYYLRDLKHRFEAHDNICIYIYMNMKKREQIELEEERKVMNDGISHS